MTWDHVSGLMLCVSCTADIDHVSVFSCSYSDFPVRQTVIMICDEVSFSALLYFICRCMARLSWNLSFSHTHVMLGVFTVDTEYSRHDHRHWRYDDVMMNFPHTHTHTHTHCNIHTHTHTHTHTVTNTHTHTHTHARTHTHTHTHTVTYTHTHTHTHTYCNKHTHL